MRVTGGKLLGIRHRELLIQHSDGGRCAGAEIRRALAAVRIGESRIRNQHIALGNIAVLVEIQQRLDIAPIDAGAGPNYVPSITANIPRNAEAGSEILALAALRRVTQKRNGLGELRLPDLFVVRTHFAVPAQTKVQGNVGMDFPVVLHIGRVLRDRHRRILRRQRGSELGWILQSRDGGRIFRIEDLVGCECVRTLDVDDRIVGERHVTEIEAELDGVPALHPGDVILGLPARFNSQFAVTQPIAEAGENVNRLQQIQP